MVRVTLEGRAPRVLRRDELLAILSSLGRDEVERAPTGRLDIEWLSPTGAVLARRAVGSLSELVSVLSSLSEFPERC